MIKYKIKSEEIATFHTILYTSKIKSMYYKTIVIDELAPCLAHLFQSKIIVFDTPKGVNTMFREKYEGEFKDD